MDCSKDACAEASELCAPLDLNDNIVGGLSKATYDQVKDIEPTEKTDEATFDALGKAGRVKRWACVRPSAWIAAKNTPSALDFGGVANATLALSGEFPVQDHCAKLAGKSAKVWLSFDPFLHTDYAGRAKLDETKEVTLDFKDGVAWVLQSKVAAPECKGGCQMKVEKSPGADFHTRMVQAESSVVTPVRKVSSNAHIDLQVTVHSSIYGQLDKDALEELADESVEMAFALTATGVPKVGCDAKWDGVPRPLEIIIATEAKAGDETTVEQLESWIKDNLALLTLYEAGYSLHFPKALRKELTEGPLSCYETFQLSACAKPEFKEAKGAGIGEATNCATADLLFLEAKVPSGFKLVPNAPDSGAANGSCVGSCGGNGGGCWCDAACVGYSDCCADYQAICVAPPPKPPATSTGSDGGVKKPALPTSTSPLPSACASAMSKYTAAAKKQADAANLGKPSAYYMLDVEKAYPYPASMKDYCESREKVLKDAIKKHGIYPDCGATQLYHDHTSAMTLHYDTLCCGPLSERYKVENATAQSLTEKTDALVLGSSACATFRDVGVLSNCPASDQAAIDAAPNLPLPYAHYTKQAMVRHWRDTCRDGFLPKVRRYGHNSNGKVTTKAEDNALFLKVMPQLCVAKQAQAERDKAFEAMQSACGTPYKPWSSNYKKNLLTGSIDPNYSKTWGSTSTMQLKAEIGFANSLTMQDNNFAVELGPYAHIWLDGHKVFSPFDIESIFEARAQVHVYSEVTKSYGIIKFHAMTKDLINLELQIPDGYEHPEPPSFSKEIEKCANFQAYVVTVRVCGGLGGSLGLEDVGGTWKGTVTTEPGIHGELGFTATPAVGITAFVSIGVDLALGVLGVKLELDPVIKLSFPAELKGALSLVYKGSKKIYVEFAPTATIDMVVDVLGGAVKWFFDGRLFVPDAEGVIYEWDPITLAKIPILSLKPTVKKDIYF